MLATPVSESYRHGGFTMRSLPPLAEDRAHQGYRNRGKRPIDAINEFAKNVQAEG